VKILITGVAGFIGSHLADALLEQGHEVTGIDDLTTGRRENVPDAVAFHFGDVRGWLPVGAEVIYHCAASYKDRADWERDASVNIGGTINVIREAQKTKARLIYFQTSLCYGPTPASPVQIDAPIAPVGSYAVSKTAGERYIRDSGLDYVSLRLANVYGPRNLSGPVPTFYQRLSEGKPCTVVDSRRDFVFIDDLVRVALHALARGSGPYHVSSGRDYAIEQLYGEVGTAMGRAAEPIRQARGPDDVATLLLDPSHTREEFGWTARTHLSTGIKAAVAWYAEHPPAEVYTHLALKG
jgi:UDP-glucose 4-epimerase